MIELINELIPEGSNIRDTTFWELIEEAVIPVIEKLTSNTVYEDSLITEATDLTRLNNIYGLDSSSTSDMLIFKAQQEFTKNNLELLGCGVYVDPNVTITDTLVLDPNIVGASNILILCPDEETYNLVNNEMPILSNVRVMIE